MANFDFFATHEDLVQVLDFIFSRPDTTLFQTYSDYDKELKEFHSTQEVLDCYKIGVDEYGNGKHHTFQLWSSVVMPKPEPRQITFTPGAIKGHTFRYEINGWGLIQLYLGGVYENTITTSYVGNNSEARARIWALTYSDRPSPDEVDWGQLQTLSNKLQYLIRKKLSPAQVSSYPVLTDAYRKYQQGVLLSTAKGGVAYSAHSAAHRSLTREQTR